MSNYQVSLNDLDKEFLEMRKMIENLAKPNGDNMVQNKEKDE
jgi:hypothetical protein